MAIVIPSKHIYDKDNNKIRDNKIDSIEVCAVEVVPNNEYKTTVYNKEFDVLDIKTISDTKTEYVDAIATNQGGSTIRNVRGACGLKYSLNYIEIPEILIPKVQDNKYISKIYDEKDENGDPQIKIRVRIKQTTYTGESSYQPSSNTFDFQNATLTKEENEEENVFYSLKEFEYKNDISSIVSSLSVSSVHSLIANHSIIEENNKLKISSYLYANSNYNWSPNAITIDNYINTNIIDGDISVTNEIINGVEYYKLSGIKVFIGADATFMSCLIENVNNLSTVLSYYRAVATRVLQKCQQISLTVYGNTIGIDLNDKTVYIPDESGDKPFSVEGNELMQTSNYYPSFELRKLNSSEFYIGYDSDERFSATITVQDNLVGKDLLVRVFEGDTNGETYVDKLYENVYKDFIVDIGGYHIYDIEIFERIEIKTNSIIDCFEKTLNEYKNGKETATILCDISDYYDTEGNKVIFQNGISKSNISFTWDKYISADITQNYYRSFITLTKGNIKQGDIIKTINGYIEFETDANVGDKCWCKIYGKAEDAENIFEIGFATIERIEQMTFSMYDKVIPMVYGANGVDKPLSKYKDGTPKKFKVLGTRIFYDGAVWQELTLQETLE